MHDCLINAVVGVLQELQAIAQDARVLEIRPAAVGGDGFEGIGCRAKQSTSVAELFRPRSARPEMKTQIAMRFLERDPERRIAA